MIRRSGRATESNATASTSKDLPELEDGEERLESLEEDSEDEQPIRKKRKKIAVPFSEKNEAKGVKLVRKPRGMRGALQQLPGMPLDILFEIFKQLDSIDLLRLTRTTKALRGILLHPSSTTMWKEARGNVAGLPECPGFISEPAFASFMFDYRCSECAASNIHTVSWGLFKRFCQKCAGRAFGSDDGVFPRKWIPQFEFPRGRKTVTMYHTATIKKWKDEYYKLPVGNARSSWDAEKAKEYEARQQDFESCKAWLRKVANERASTKQSAIERRRDEIMERLKNLGWGEELSKIVDIQQLHHNPLFMQKKDITEKIWNALQPQLNTLMENIKVARLKKAYDFMIQKRRQLIEDVRQAYTKTSPINAIIPSKTDICYFPPFRTIIEDTDEDVSLTLEHFRDAMKQLPELISAWIECKDAQLLKMMKAELGGSDEPDSSHLPLATTFFKCSNFSTCGYRCGCDNLLSYPRVLVHRGVVSGLTNHIYGTRSNEEDLSATLHDYGGKIHFSKSIRDHAATIVELCGLDPLVATAREMDELDPLYVVIDESDNFGRTCMTWRRAVRYKCDQAGQLELLEGDLREEARKRIDEDLTIKKWKQGDNLCCTHCHLRGEITALAKHVQDDHGISHPTNKDIDVYIDANIIPETVYIVNKPWKVRRG